jgi:hypothetical protein
MQFFSTVEFENGHVHIVKVGEPLSILSTESRPCSETLLAPNACRQ